MNLLVGLLAALLVTTVLGQTGYLTKSQTPGARPVVLHFQRYFFWVIQHPIKIAMGWPSRSLTCPFLSLGAPIPILRKRSDRTLIWLMGGPVAGGKSIGNGPDYQHQRRRKRMRWRRTLGIEADQTLP